MDPVLRDDVKKSSRLHDRLTAARNLAFDLSEALAEHRATRLPLRQRQDPTRSVEPNGSSPQAYLRWLTERQWQPARKLLSQTPLPPRAAKLAERPDAKLRDLGYSVHHIDEQRYQPPR